MPLFRQLFTEAVECLIGAVAVVAVLAFCTPASAAAIGMPSQPQFDIEAINTMGYDVGVHWEPPASGVVASYQFRTGSDAGEPYYLEGRVGEPYAHLVDIPQDTQYWFCVSAVSTTGELSEPACNSFHTPSPDSPPDFPRWQRFEVTAVDESGADMQVTWGEPSTGPADSYRYSGGTISGPSWSVSGTSIDRMELLADVPVDGEFWFCVTTIDYEGQESTEAGCVRFESPSTAVPGMPTRVDPRLNYLTETEGGIVVYWYPPTVGDAARYLYTAGSHTYGWMRSGATEGQETAFFGLERGESIWFCVRAENYFGVQSEDHACVSAQVP